MKSIVYFSGESIEVEGIETKLYLNYRINKEDLHHLGRNLDLVIEHPLDIEDYEYARMTYNQLTGKTIIEFDKYKQGFDYKVIEPSWGRDEFFRIISIIEG